MEIKFTPEHKVLNELFGRDVKYIIPEYQRPYSWDCIGKSDKNNQVNILWEDIYSYYRSGDKNTYFIGSMVLIGNGEAEYQVVDGQQRLTTLVLLFTSIKCFLEKKLRTLDEENIKKVVEASLNIIEDLLYNKVIRGAIVLENKVKIERMSGFDYDKVLKMAVSCGTIPDDVLKEATSEQIQVSNRYIKNRDYFESRLEKEFTQNGRFTQEAFIDLNNFVEFLKSKVSVVRILTGSFDIAYHVFEILNNRGLPLSNKDLFRNFLIKEFDKVHGTQNAREANEKWVYLDENYTLNDDFLSRWVESHRGSQQRYSAYNDIKDIYDKEYHDTVDKPKIQVFYNDIERSLSYYTQIIDVSFSDPIIKSKINFLLHAGNVRYTLNFLLAIANEYNGIPNNEEVLELIKSYERYSILCMFRGRFSNAPVYEAIDSVKHRDIELVKNVLAFYEYPEQEQILRFDISDVILDNYTAKLLLCKYYWIEMSKRVDDQVYQELLYDKTTLEHIIPQYPEKGTNWLRDFSVGFREQFTYSLGNMTLLTQKLNSAARNYDFSRKKEHYKKTSLWLTSNIGNWETITEDRIKERHEDIVKTICEDIGL